MHTSAWARKWLIKLHWSIPIEFFHLESDDIRGNFGRRNMIFRAKRLESCETHKHGRKYHHRYYLLHLNKKNENFVGIQPKTYKMDLIEIIYEKTSETSRMHVEDIATSRSRIALGTELGNLAARRPAWRVWPLAFNWAIGEILPNYYKSLRKDRIDYFEFNCKQRISANAQSRSVEERMAWKQRKAPSLRRSDPFSTTGVQFEWK